MFIDAYRDRFGVEPICKGVAGRPVDVLVSETPPTVGSVDPR